MKQFWILDTISTVSLPKFYPLIYQQSTYIIVLKLKGKLLRLLLQDACKYKYLLLQLFILRYTIFFNFLNLYDCCNDFYSKLL